MKAIKYICYFIIGIVLLILALFACLVLFFNPNNYKAQIETLVKEQANIELNIDGDINWTFYPWLGISIQNTSAASVDTPDKPFAKIKELDLSVKLMPLFKGEIQMNDVNINGLTIDLEKDSKGKTNWDKVGETATAENTQSTSDKPEEKKKETETKGTSSINLNVNSVTVNETKIIYKDVSAGQDYQVNNVHLSTGPIVIGQPIIIKLGANFNSVQPKLSTTINLETTVAYDLDAQRYEAKDLNLSSNISGDMFNGKTAKFTARGDLVADLKANTAAWNKLRLTLDDLKLSGNINATDITGNNPAVKGALTADTFNLRTVLADIGISLPTMADSKALTQVGFSTNLSGSTKAVALNDLKIKLDSTNFTGSVAVTDLAKQAIKVQLRGDTINVDNYLPPVVASKQDTKTTTTTTGQGKTVTVNQPAWSTDPLFDPKSLQGLNVDADFSMDQLTVKKLPWQSFNVKLTAKNGVINLQNAGGKLFNGAINVKASLNASTNTPQITLQPTVSNLMIEKLLASQEIKDVPIRGIFNLNGNLHTAGLSEASLIKNLNGTASFSVNDGALVGENFEYQVCKAVALVRKQTLTSQFNRTETKFKQLKGSLNFINGIASNQDLTIAVAGFDAKGKGTFNLQTMMVDYKIGLALTGEQEVGGDAACKVNKDVAGIDFPLICKGSVLAGGNLCGIDSSAIGQMALDVGKAKAKEEINKQLDKQKEKLNEKLEKKLGDKAPNVKGLLKGILK